MLRPLLHLCCSALLGSLLAAAVLAVEGSTETFTGELTIIHADDPDRGASEVFYTIEGSAGAVAFHLPGRRGEEIVPTFETRRLTSGLQVRIRGIREGDAILLAEIDGVPEMEIITPLPSNRLFAPLSDVGVVVSAAVTAEAHPSVVILGDFQDKALGPTCTNPLVDDLMFGIDPNSVASNFGESSFGQVAFAGDTVGPYTIPYDSTGFDYLGWQAALQSAALNDGVDLSAYLHQVYVLPQNATGWSGLGTTGIGGVGYGAAWVFRCDRPGAYAHEVAHNLEMGHASRYFVDTGVIWTYGDSTDNMGSQITVRHYNAPHKVGAGWMPPGAVQTVTSDGVYVIRRLEEDTGEVMVLAIENLDPHISPFDTDTYWVSYRVGVGTDANLSSLDKNKVFIHEASSSPGRTYLRTWLDTGETFLEPAGSASEVAVTLVSQDSEYATLQVSGVPPAAMPVPSVPGWGRVVLGLAILAGLAHRGLKPVTRRALG